MTSSCNGSTDQPDLALLVGAARSGTTLLRLLLDSHPMIGCPAEAGIPSLAGHLIRVWSTVDDSKGESVAPRDPRNVTEEGPPDGASLQFERLSAEAKRAIREALRGPMRSYCHARGKRMYCDKSLDSVHQLGAIQAVFPDTPVILLSRHVMDTVASGLEASPWGFQAYGYGPFIAASTGNFVAALASYWLNHVDTALRWAELHGELVIKLRYEDLVRDTEHVLAEVWRFLDVDVAPEVVRTLFSGHQVAAGPGDYKIAHTTGIDTGSVGHGRRIPVGLIPPGLREEVNDRLVLLGYEALDETWNTRFDETQATNGRGDSAAKLRAIVGADRPSRARPDVDAETMDAETEDVWFGLIAVDDESVRWVGNLTTGELRRGDGDVDHVIVGTVEDLLLMVTGGENLGVLLRGGRLRHVGSNGDERPPNLPKLLNEIADHMRRDSVATGATAT